MYGPERAPVGGERWVAALFAGVLLIGFGLEVARDFSPAKSTVLFMLLSMPVLLVLHELGHAVVAALLGWKICRIVIGYGRTILRSRVAGVPVEIRILPIGGHVLPAPVELRRPRLESALIYAAGPGAELLVLVLLAALVGFDEVLKPSDQLGMLAVQSVGLLVLIDLFTNLVPLPVKTEDNIVWTDGLGMLMSPFLSRLDFQRSATLPWALRAEASDDDEERARIFEDGVARQPDNPFMRIGLAEALEAVDPERAEHERRRALTDIAGSEDVAPQRKRGRA